MRINTNINAVDAQRNLAATGMTLAKSVERLSSGLRINRAADDAAGLSISEKLRAQTRGLAQATRNAQDGISMIQTAEGALTEVHSMLQRMRELAVQASNDTLSTTDRAAVDTEFQQLKAEINHISSTTKFNGKSLLTGSLQTSQSGGTLLVGSQYNTTGGNATVSAIDVTGAKPGETYTVGGSGTNLTLTRLSDGLVETVSVAGGVSASSTTSVNFSTMGVSLNLSSDAGAKTGAGLVTDLAATTIITSGAGGAANYQIGSDAADGISVTFGQVDTSAASLNLDTALTAFTTALAGTNTAQVSAAQGLITAVDSAVVSVSSSRSNLGGVQNRLEHTIANLGVAHENVMAAESRIRDADMAEEMVTFTKTQILQQAGTAILAQANSAPQSILSLLRG